MDTFRKVMFYVTIVIAVLCLFSPVTLLQLLPFVLVIILMWFGLFDGKNTRIAILVLSVVMLFINLVAVSFVDVGLWLLIIAAFYKE